MLTYKCDLFNRSVSVLVKPLSKAEITKEFVEFFSRTLVFRDKIVFYTRTYGYFFRKNTVAGLGNRIRDIKAEF